MFSLKILSPLLFLSAALSAFPPASTALAFTCGDASGPSESGNTCSVTTDYTTSASHKGYFGGGGPAYGSGNADNNKVTGSPGVNFGTGGINDYVSVYGGAGFGLNGLEASGNVVELDGGRVFNNYGGNGESGGRVIGGWIASNAFNSNGHAYHNQVILRNGTILNTAVGGWNNNSTGDAAHNLVHVYDAKLSLRQAGVHGGIKAWWDGDGAGGFSSKGRVYSNTAIVEGGSIAGYVYGGITETGNAYSNTAEFRGGALNISFDGAKYRGGSIYGGYASGAGQAYKNKALVSGGTVQGDVVGGQSTDGRAYQNLVTVEGTADVGGHVIGSFLSAASNFFESYENEVSVLGGRVEGHVYGSFSGGAAPALNNTVRLGPATIGGGVYGASVGRAGHRLIVQGFQGTLQEVNNFDKYEFTIPASLADGATLITISGPTATDMTGSSVEKISLETGSPLRFAHRVILIDKAEGAYQQQTLTVPYGPSEAYDVTVKLEGSALTALFSDLDVPGQGPIITPEE